MTDVETSAAFLYDGGWRSADREELMREYDLSESETDEICKSLDYYESRKHEQEEQNA